MRTSTTSSASHRLKGRSDLRGDLLDWTVSSIKRFGIRPRERFGQNYVVDQRLIECLIETAKIEPDEVVLEIGAGIGALTLRLSERAGKVIAVEMDRNAVRALSETVSGSVNVEIVIGDVMEMELPKVDKIVSNLPFSISTPLTLKLLRDCSFELAVLTYQKEVAERLLARPGSREYSRLSVVTSLLAEVEKIKDFPPEAFYPKPKVYSTVVAMRKRACDLSAWPALEEALKILFSQRRRKLKNAIEIYCKLKGLDLREVSSRVGERYLSKRVFELEPNDFLYLSGAMSGVREEPQADG